MGKNRIVTYREALREALREEMLRDQNVVLIGEDIGVYGGGFRVTRGLIGEFGEERVLETPISETAFTGMAVGAAMTGLRPVVEYMFSDFSGVCFDQIINEAAKAHYLYNGIYSVPMVLRCAQGAGTGAGAQHSQSLETLYCHIPGLKVIVPSTPSDAKGLLKSAIRDPDPVIFLEEKLLYDTVGELPNGDKTIEIGKADIKREGSDITIITYGRMVLDALKAARILEDKGIDARVLDLRTLLPLDSQAIIDSVSRTGRALIVHEAVRFAGFGAEISSLIMESDAYNHLKSPVRRLGAAFCPMPAARIMEQNVIPCAGDIVRAAIEMCAKSGKCPEVGMRPRQANPPARHPASDTSTPREKM